MEVLSVVTFLARGKQEERKWEVVTLRTLGDWVSCQRGERRCEESPGRKEHVGVVTKKASEAHGGLSTVEEEETGGRTSVRSVSSIKGQNLYLPEIWGASTA